MGAAFGRPRSGHTRARHARSHLAVVRGKPELAMAWLEAARHAVVPGAEITTDFLRMTGQLAERQQRDAVALDAYRQLLTTPMPSCQTLIPPSGCCKWTTHCRRQMWRCRPGTASSSRAT